MSEISGPINGKYEIQKLIGSGGMAYVYLARDVMLNRMVAIKIIRKGAFPPKDYDHLFRRFEIEAKTLARLDHPNIVKIYDYGEYDGSPYLVMECISGGTLKDLMGKPYPYNQAASILAPIADGLAYANKHGILHRDVKPANILLREDGQPVLSDFGIAKLLEQNETEGTLTEAGFGVGTPEYMSPEQCIGKIVDGRADEYSLGIIFYELCTGRKPYSGKSATAVMLSQINDPVPDLSKAIENIPSRVSAILMKALAKKPDDRYQTTSEFAEVLRKLSMDKNVKDPIPVNQPPSQPDDTGTETVSKIEKLDMTRLEKTPKEAGKKGKNRFFLYLIPLIIGIVIISVLLLPRLIARDLSNKIITETPASMELITDDHTALTMTAAYFQNVTAEVSTENPAEATITEAADTSSATKTETAIPAAVFTATETKTLIPTEEPTPTKTKTLIPTETFTATDTDTPILTEAPTATETPTHTATATVTLTHTLVPSDTLTATPLPTSTDTPTMKYTPTAAATNTAVPTMTDIEIFLSGLEEGVTSFFVHTDNKRTDAYKEPVMVKANTIQNYSSRAQAQRNGRENQVSLNQSIVFYTGKWFLMGSDLMLGVRTDNNIEGYVYSGYLSMIETVENTYQLNRIKTLWFPKTGMDIEAADFIQFGNFDGHPLQWQVLSIDADGNALLLSQYLIASLPYNSEQGYNTSWENSTIHSWLNHDFLESAFSSSDQSFLLDPENGNLPEDKISLLSKLDYEQSQPTFAADFYSPCWLIDSYTGSSDRALYVDFGTSGISGHNVVTNPLGIRPVIKVNLYDLSKYMLTVKMTPEPMISRTTAASLTSFSSVLFSPTPMATATEPVALELETTEEPIVMLDHLWNPEIDEDIYIGNSVEIGYFDDKPIQWLVLDIDKNGKMLLFSEHSLKKDSYNPVSRIDTTWENSSIRKWLNEDFLEEAFPSISPQRTVVMEAELKNGVNYDENSLAGKQTPDTVDTVFLLSVPEYRSYQKIIMACDNNSEVSDYWLRSQGQDSTRGVNIFGETMNDKAEISKEKDIRPAIYVDKAALNNYYLTSNPAAVKNLGKVWNPEFDTQVLPGYTVEFGRYNDETINWLVLTNSYNGEDGYLLLLSEKPLFESLYHESASITTTWESSVIRKRLNDEFFEDAFPVGSLTRDILLSDSADREKIGQVFLLSEEEYRSYRQVIDEFDRLFTYDDEKAAYWLRSAGDDATCAVNVRFDSNSGKIRVITNTRVTTVLDIRPAIAVHLTDLKNYYDEEGFEIK